MGNNLTYQDDIYITLPGTVPVAPVPTPTLVTCAISGSAMGYVTTVNGGWNFRVTSVTGVVLGDVCTFTGLQVQGASLASNNGVLFYQANRFITGQLVDSASSSAGLAGQEPVRHLRQRPADDDGLHPAERRDQRVRRSSAVLDGGEPLARALARAPLRADTLAFLTTVDGNATTFTGPTVTTTAQVVTIDNGSFDWTDTAAPAGTCFDSGLVNFTGWTVATTSTCNSLVLNGPATNTANDGYFYVPGTKILSPTDWAGKVKWTYSLGSVSGTKELTWDPGGGRSTAPRCTSSTCRTARASAASCMSPTPASSMRTVRWT